MVTLYSFNLDAQGQLTLKLVVGCGRKSNSFLLLWLSLLPARMKKIQLKMKALEWSQQYPSIFKTLKGSLLHIRSSMTKRLTSTSCTYVRSAIG